MRGRIPCVRRIDAIWPVLATQQIRTTVRVNCEGGDESDAVLTRQMRECIACVKSSPVLHDEAPMTECVTAVRSDVVADPIGQLIGGLAEFHKLHPEMTVSRLLLFLHVAARPGIKQADLEQLTGFVQSGCSRAVAVLSKFERHDRPGLDLVESLPNPQDRRHNVVALTAKGQLLAAAVRRAVSEGITT
jgi:DNA-binding MarR family transcriptional regulator